MEGIKERDNIIYPPCTKSEHPHQLSNRILWNVTTSWYVRAWCLQPQVPQQAVDGRDQRARIYW